MKLHRQVGLLLAAVVAAVAVLMAVKTAPPPAHSTGGTGATQGIVEPGKPHLVEFGATWCPPCKELEPTLRKVADRFHNRLVVRIIHEDEQPGVSDQYGVQYFPTLILFDRDGREVERLVGLISERELLAKLRQHGFI